MNKTYFHSSQSPVKLFNPTRTTGKMLHLWGGTPPLCRFSRTVTSLRLPPSPVTWVFSTAGTRSSRGASRQHLLLRQLPRVPMTPPGKVSACGLNSMETQHSPGTLTLSHRSLQLRQQTCCVTWKKLPQCRRNVFPSNVESF